MTVRVGINGFGRIGRNILRVLIESGREYEVVAVNDITKPATLAHLLKYDTILGRFQGEVVAEEDALVVNGKRIRVLAIAKPADLPWRELGVDYVIESTGLFTSGEAAHGHIEAGASKVLITAPATGEDLTVVMGVNDGDYDPERHHVVSNASCTTNCLAPVVKVLNDSFGIVSGLMTTVHAYTNDQKILDAPHKDLRRARAAAQAIIPTTTGAAKAVSLVIPAMKGKFHGLALRVPVPDVSLVDLVATLEKDVTVDSVNRVLKDAADGPMAGILGVSDEELVSADYLHEARSSVVDAKSTMVIADRQVKVLAWYDNEWGYSNRVVDLMFHMADKDRTATRSAVGETVGH